MLTPRQLYRCLTSMSMRERIGSLRPEPLPPTELPRCVGAHLPEGSVSLVANRRSRPEEFSLQIKAIHCASVVKCIPIPSY